MQNETDKKAIKETLGVCSKVIPSGHHLPTLSLCKKNIILWVGRSDRIKRPELFINLAEQIPNELFTMICQHATDDKNYEQLVAQAERVKNLEFIQGVPFNEIDNYFQCAKLLVCTSESEGFPNTYVQACKHATPVLSLCVNPDNFLNRHKCGICADGDWSRFISQLKVLLKPEGRERYGENARLYAEKNHNIKKIVEEYKHILSKLASSRS